MRRVGGGVIAVLMIAATVPAMALDFSADMVSTGGGRSVSGKIFVTGEKVRMEMAGATTITRMDKKVAWVMMPDQGMYMEQPFQPERVAGATEKMPGEVERTVLGPDSVDGRPVTKVRIVYTAPEGRATVLQWIDDASKIPLKTEAEDGSWSVAYRHLVVGPQDAALFEIPAGYQKFAMPNMADMMAAAQRSMADEMPNAQE